MGNIEHLVVLMLENRSFDHIFGYRNGVAGLTGTESNLLDPALPTSPTNPRFNVSNDAAYAIPVGGGPGHSVHATNYQLCNDVAGPSETLRPTNNGFVRSYRDELIHDKVAAPTPDQIKVVMQSFRREMLPSLNALADAFCVCDHWYAEVPGPTQPNRLYIHAGTSAGIAFNQWKRQIDVPTVYEKLQENGRSWTTYWFDQNEVMEFSRLARFSQGFRMFETHFAQDIRDGILPNYSFVIPRFFDSNTAGGITDGFANTQHPPADVRYADNLIADVYDALRANPAIWARSALIVTYDEHGGFYDHVVPPGNVPNPDGINSPSPGDPPYAPVFKFDRLGLRVPTVIASPWVKPGRVDSTLYQHTSVLATLDKLFGLTGSLTRRDAAANSFDGLFSELTELRSDTPVKLPRSSLPTVPLTAADPRHPANLPLDADQMDILQRVYHLTADIQPQQITAATLPRTQADAHEFVRASLQQYMMNMAK